MIEYQKYEISHVVDFLDTEEDAKRAIGVKLNAFANEEGLYLEREIIDETSKWFSFKGMDGPTMIFQFAARKRTDDDDQRERIEYMIENLA